MTSLNQRFDGMEQRLDGMDRRLDGMEQRLDRRLDALVGAVRGVDGRVEQVDAKLDVALTKLVNSVMCTDLRNELVEVPALRRVDGVLRAALPSQAGIATPTRVDQLLLAGNEGHPTGGAGTVDWNLDKSKALLTFYTECAATLEPAVEAGV
jgi:hypothetical protein